MNKKIVKQKARKMRVRGKMTGSALKPRLSVHRTNKYIYIQAIDDEGQKTVAAASDIRMKEATGTKTEHAKAVAEEIAKKLKSKKVTQLIFDRGYLKYHGRVKAIAEALREQGLHV
jgi:large subunit ribosomal protein L18